MKQFLALCLLASVLLVAWGCAASGNTSHLFGNSPAETNNEDNGEGDDGGMNKKISSDRIIQYLNEKYGEKFTYLYSDGNYFSDTDRYYVSCESLPGEKITVEVKGLNKNIEDLRDNYLLFKHQKEIYALILSAAEAEFGQSNVIVYYSTGVSVPNEKLPADATLDQILNDDGVLLSALIEVRSGKLTTLEQAERAMQSVTSRGCRYALSIVALEAPLYGTLSVDEINQRVEKDDYEHLAVLSKGSNRARSSWYDGGG